ncbi:MAG: methanogenesis marker 14 protein [Candidatus Lokiarchaeota archaeon]|nr:methanogenesis marker 14 protein [Candidatus Lokiarchaeota archaeon]
MGPFYTVISVELGNTTTKCVLMTTNLKTGIIYQIEKEVQYTRKIRPPHDNESVFGSTVVGVELAHNSVTEFISKMVSDVVRKSRLDIEKDIHFVVRSTGVTASFGSPEEVHGIIKALADGCLNAGIPPQKMMATLDPAKLPPGLQDYSWLKRVYFDGAIASCLPPAETGIVANEMEGELVTAGIKGASKGTQVDFRNPVMTLDFGTTLAGRITDDSYPYAKTIGSFAGLAGAIPDALVRGSGQVDPQLGCTLDLHASSQAFSASINLEWVEEISRLIRVQRLSKGTNRFGTVPVNPQAATEANVVLIGVDVGRNGSRLSDLEGIGGAIFKESGAKGLLTIIDYVQLRVLQRILTVAQENDLVLRNTSLGLTGRAITSAGKPLLIAENLHLADGSLWVAEHPVLFVQDGLAMGAAVAARCMNSMGTPHEPLGGRKGDRCIMSAREKVQKKKKT